MYSMWERIKACVLGDDGPTATEYAVLLGIIAIGVMASFASFGDRMNDIYTNINGAVDAGFAG